VAGFLGWTVPVPREESREREILRFLTRSRHVNEISEALGIAVPELLPCLLEMEFRKLLERRAGDYYKKMSVGR
jgi:predicted Rossmann fold nucleotide-binding protein DprA/Smf involved in DNA uptake